jgi:hypothetical protein
MRSLELNWFVHLLAFMSASAEADEIDEVICSRELMDLLRSLD